MRFWAKVLHILGRTGQALNLMRAAWKVKTVEDGEKPLVQLARFREREYESAARRLREAMQEMFLRKTEGCLLAASGSSKKATIREHLRISIA